MNYILFNVVMFVVFSCVKFILLPSIPLSSISKLIVWAYGVTIFVTFLWWFVRIVRRWTDNTLIQYTMLDKRKIQHPYLWAWIEFIVAISIVMVIGGWSVHENYLYIISNISVVGICLSSYEMFRLGLIFVTEKIFSQYSGQR